ncbi:MAG: hypothetical protein DMF80_17710 [Acidobacteria bacterium]|nr:MAG: hypothetical protein DMF80_17710 [Acidobacteriota bacterium]PYQ26230.1 MAG: hypothetical protein DMF81_00200 [Acidobacteriota bacterium]
MTAASRVLLLTGRPGVGKSTLMRRVAAALASRPVGGFTTAEIREGGQRLGFRLETFDGRQAVLARVGQAGPRVGRYGVDVAAMDAVAASALAVDARTEAYLVDEIGRMECLSAGFVSAMKAVLASDRPVVATVAARGGGLIAEVKKRDDTELWPVTRGNRDGRPEQVRAWLAERLKGRGRR